MGTPFINVTAIIIDIKYTQAKFALVIDYMAIS